VKTAPHRNRPAEDGSSLRSDRALAPLGRSLAWLYRVAA